MEKELQAVKSQSRSLYLSMFFSLFCIFFQEQARLIFLRAFITLPDHETFNLWWAIGQCVGFPLLGIISDLRSRKKILCLAIAFLCCSLVALQLGWTMAAIFFYSLGAVSTVARAVFCEVHVKHIEHKLQEKRAPNIIYTFLAEPWAWIFFSYIIFSSREFFQTFSYLSVLEGLILFHLTWKYLKDPRGKPTHKLSFLEFFNEVIRGKKKIIALRGLAAVLIVILTFYAGETVWSAAEYYTGSGHKLAVVGTQLEMSLGFYYLFGILIALLFKKWVSKYAEIFLGLSFGGIALVVLLCFLYWRANGFSGDVIKSMFPFVTLVGGVGLPLIYVFFGGSKKIGTHLLGMIYGVIEALQNLTDISGAYFEKIFDISLHESLFVLILFTIFFVSFLLYLFISIYKIKNNKFQGDPF